MGALVKSQKEEFELLLQQAEIDLTYACFLKEYSGENDIFGIVIDRDYKTHSVTQMKRIGKRLLDPSYVNINRKFEKCG